MSSLITPMHQIVASLFRDHHPEAQTLGSMNAFRPRMRLRRVAFEKRRRRRLHAFGFIPMKYLSELKVC